MSARTRPSTLVINGLGFVTGLLLGLGVLAYLQQSGSVYPTRNVTILFVAGGMLFNGVLLPTLGRWRKLRREVAAR